MKKFTYLFAVATLALASCGNPTSYTITGTMAESMDGDTVYIMERTNRQFIPLEMTIVANGKFTFTGVQDSAVNRYIAYQGEDDINPSYFDFFLENGKIKIDMVRGTSGSRVSGTPTNKKYQEFKDKLNAVEEKQARLQKTRPVTDEEKKANQLEMKAADAEATSLVKNTILDNLSSPFGVFLLKNFNYYIEYSDVDEILSKLPQQYQDDETISGLKSKVEVAKKTGVGEKFTDFEMADPEGNLVKLSDYAGKGKLVLLDFWASWCPPCRREMPKLVEAYAKYKDKDFEIVGVSFDSNADAWKKGLEQLEMTWPQMSDLKYWDSEAGKLYAIRSIPHVVLIDGEGTIVSRGLHGDELQEKIAELLQIEL